MSHKVVCFDVETTGLSPAQDDLLQITIVDDECNILFESYIHPETRVSWNNARMTNHITYDMVKDAPTLEEITPTLRSIFDQADIILGYNVGFDVKFVESKCHFAIDPDKIIDCFALFKEDCKKYGFSPLTQKLGDAVDFYCPEAKADYLANAHDASCDSIATMKVYLAWQDKTRERHYQKITLSNTSHNFLNFLATAKKEAEQQEVAEEEPER